MTDQNIKEVFSGLLSSFEKEEKELFEKLSEGINLERINDGEDFDLLLHYQFKKFLKGFIKVKFGDNNMIHFLLMNHQFVESHFLKWIIQKEGSACSSDKSRTIMSSIFKSKQTDGKIKWDYDAEYTYHLPKKVFKTHEEIISFFESLYHLFYGNPDKYLNHLQKYLIGKPVV